MVKTKHANAKLRTYIFIEDVIIFWMKKNKVLDFDTPNSPSKNIHFVYVSHIEYALK